jgi:hypothetical protein
MEMVAMMVAMMVVMVVVMMAAITTSLRGNHHEEFWSRSDYLLIGAYYRTHTDHFKKIDQVNVVVDPAGLTALH